MVKGLTKTVDADLANEEFEYVRSNPHHDWLRQVFRVAHIEYGRIDYGFVGDRPQVWEINLFPTLVAPIWQRTASHAQEEDLRQHSRAVFFERFEAAFQRLDGALPERPDGSVKVSFRDTLLRQLRAQQRSARLRSLHRTVVDRASGWRILQPAWRRLRPLMSKLAGPTARMSQPK
jgi:hypothetical protein